MSFFEKLEFNRERDNRELTIDCETKRYTITVKDADIKYDESGLFIFTDRENYRHAINSSKIVSISWDLSQNS